MTQEEASQRDILPYIPEGVTSPIFWGSLLGMFVGSTLTGLSYMGIIGSLPVQIIDGKLTQNIPNPLVVFFSCLLCIRYYASVVFLTYDDFASETIRSLEKKARWTIFITQLLLITGCSLNIAVLPVFGGWAASVVIVAQAMSIIPYWIILSNFLFKSPDGDFRLLLALGDVTILISACLFLLWELRLLPYSPTTGGLFMGATIFVFIGESVTTYRKSTIFFLKKTIESLNCPLISPPSSPE
jgi:hypothetical protein